MYHIHKKKFQIGKLVNKRFKKLLISLRSPEVKKFARARLFSLFIGMVKDEHEEISHDLMKKYLDFYDKFVKKMIQWNFKDTQPRAYFPYNYYFDFLKQFSSGRMQEDDYDELKAHLSKIKHKDPEKLFP